MEWYPSNKQELNKLLDALLSKTPKIKDNLNNKEIHGLIVPHAGYAYSGEIAGKTFSILKNKKIDKAIVFGPSHYKAFKGILPLEKISHEHSVDNQIPFLQKLGIKEILPIVVGEINQEEAKNIAEKYLNNFKKENKKTIFIFSTDLSHFLNYEIAKKRDLKSIDVIENLKESEIENIDACGIYPLLILFQMCKIKFWKPKLIEYKNLGDITGDKSSVVGYAGFWF